MCGILGTLKNGQSPESIRIAFDRIIHRGPDVHNYFENEKIFLGTHRLKIQDLSVNGDQPMRDVTGRYIMIYNGEIYNHASIRKDLLQKGHQFKSNSDTETVLYGYIQYGKDILNKLNGIFAFAIYDTEQNTLFGARDQLGVKPLYYYMKDDHFAFGSEIKSLIALDHFDNSINHKAIANYINFLWSPGSLTPFQYVFKILPGEYFTLDLSDISTFTRKIFYDVPFSGSREFYNDKVWINTIDKKLENAVDAQLLSDVPVGFFLSGGIDSSVIVAEARKRHPERPLHCFTIKTNEDSEPEGFSDDYDYAVKAAKHLKVDLHTVDGSISILKDFDKMIWHLDEPQADIAPLYVYKVCETAKEHGIKVLLSGAGGDDIFSGYRRHKALYYDKYLQYAPDFIFPLLAKYLQNKSSNIPTVRRLNKLLKRKSDSVIDRLVGYFEWFPISDHLHLFSKDIQPEVSGFDPDDYFYHLLDKVEEEENLLNKMLYLELKTFLVDHNLNYTDKMGMACGVEVRVPYLDIDLVNLSTKLPPDLKMRGDTTKYILRKIAERYLPDTIVKRSKTGFGAPVRKWVINDLDHMVSDRLYDSSLYHYGIFDSAAIQQLVEDNKKGKVDGSYTILTVMAIQSWLDQFIKK